MDGHSHESDHAHCAGGHRHAPSPEADRRWLTVALAVICGFMAIEVAVGVLANSLALISDAAHMLTDAFAIVLALVAMRLAARPAHGAYTFGLKRAEIFSAQINGLSLLLLAGWLAYEAVGRLGEPPKVTGWMVIVTGLTGLAVNLVAAWAMSRANRSSLNIEGAYRHVLMDAVASLAATAAGVIVLATGFQRADAIATLVVVALMVKGGWALVRDSGRILLNAAPAGTDTGELAADMLAVPDVVEVHDLHVWAITSGHPALSAHVLVNPAADCHTLRISLEHLLADMHEITHTTLQVDHLPPPLLQIGHGDGAGGAHCSQPHGPAHRRIP